MKKVTIQLLTALLLTALCLFADNLFAQSKNRSAKRPVIKKADKWEGRQLYDVTLPNGKKYSHMVWEEVRQGIRTGRWQYNDAFVYGN